MVVKQRRSKQKTKINISEAIRDYLTDHPQAKPAEIVDYLFREKNETVSAQYVSTIKSNTVRKVQGRLSDDPGVQNMRLAKEFCRKLGGIEKAVQVLRDYADLLE